jgi:hypothetical protein
MNEPLRPLTLGEILDRTVQFYRARFLVYLGISIIPTGTVLILASAAFFFIAWWGTNGAGAASSVVAGIIAVVFIAAIAVLALPVCLGATAMAAAAMNHAVNTEYYGGKITIRHAYKAVWPRGWRYIWLYLLQAILIWVAPGMVWIVLILVAAGLSALAARAGMGTGAGALFGALAVVVVVALIGYAAWMLLRLCLAFPACVVEQIGAWDALKRSSALSKGTRGRVFLLYLLGTVLSWMLSGGVTLIVTIVLALIPGASSPQRAQTTGMIVIFSYYAAAFAVQALTKPVYGIALTLFYYDQRIRQEGFDIEWMMLQAGLVVPAPAVVVTQSEAQPWMAPAGAGPVASKAEASAQARESDSTVAIAEEPAAPDQPPDSAHEAGTDRRQVNPEEPA